MLSDFGLLDFEAAREDEPPRFDDVTDGVLVDAIEDRDDAPSKCRDGVDADLDD